MALAHALGLRLVAEGVEDDATGAVLARLGCDVAQGYAIARPMPVADFLQWLARLRPRPPGGPPRTERARERTGPGRTYETKRIRFGAAGDRLRAPDMARSGAMPPMPSEPRTRWWGARPPALVLLTAVIALGFAAGVPLVPHSPVELLVFDVVLLNAAPLVASVVCLRAARRVPEERLVWWGAAVASVLNVIGNLVYALAVAPLAEEPFPSVADAFWLAGYPALFVVTLALLRSRVPRPRASTWVDGLVGALGVTAVAAAVFITPAVTAQHPDSLAAVANLAYPVADVLLLALLGSIPAVLGARIDGTVLALCAVLVSKLVGDVLVAAAQAGDGYEPGGPLDLTWMVNAVLTAGAAAAARPRRPARVAGNPTGGVPSPCRCAAPSPPSSSSGSSGVTGDAASARSAPSPACSPRSRGPSSRSTSSGPCTRSGGRRSPTT